MEYQVYLNDEQKNYLIKYVKDKRYINMMIMVISLVIAVTGFWLWNMGIQFLNSIISIIIVCCFIKLIQLGTVNEKKFGVITPICCLILYIAISIHQEDVSRETDVFLGRTEFFSTLAASVEIFIMEFVMGFGKTFGHRCDIQCIEKDLYTLEYANFGYREKDTKKHPYYICDNRGETYICPKFLDYKNADTSDKFLYIKLNNGRNYAIGDHIFMK